MEETRKTIQKKLNHDEILKRVQLAMLRQNTVTYANNKRILQRRREEMKNVEAMMDKKRVKRLQEISEQVERYEKVLLPEMVKKIPELIAKDKAMHEFLGEVSCVERLML